MVLPLVGWAEIPVPMRRDPSENEEVGRKGALLQVLPSVYLRLVEDEQWRVPKSQPGTGQDNGVSTRCERIFRTIQIACRVAPWVRYIWV